MTDAPTDAEPVTDEWCAHHFDYTSSKLSANFEQTLDRMRADHPIARTDAHGGHWVVTRYQDVLSVAQDWRTFSSEQRDGNGSTAPPVTMIPESVDPPLHAAYRQLMTAYLSPAAVARYEPATRALATRLIDDFVEAGECDFMAEFARPFPGLMFFDQVLHAPADEIVEINEMAYAASLPGHPRGAESWHGLFTWTVNFVEQRRGRPPRDDVIQAVLTAEVEGRPISDEEIYGIIILLILGGLETTAGALGQFVIRFSREPEIPALLRRQPELIPDAIEELLRLEGPFVSIMRTATCDAAIGDHAIRAGEQVMIYFASANRDESEFACPAQFDPSRSSNRHFAFGVGPHRCAGLNLARMNMRVALEELLPRLDDIRLRDGAEPLAYHLANNRGPHAVPITFAPGPRSGS